MTWLIRLLVYEKVFLVYIHWLEEWHMRALKNSKIPLDRKHEHMWASCVAFDQQALKDGVDKASSESSCSTCTACQRVCLRWQCCCREAAGDGSLWWCCVVLMAMWGRALQGTKCRHSSDLTAISEMSSCRVCSSLWPMPFFSLSLLPLVSLLVRVNLHHVSFNREKGGESRALVEACEPDTTVNLHFHNVTLCPSPPCSLSFFFYWHVTHWTSRKLHRAELRTSGEARQIPT